MTLTDGQRRRDANKLKTRRLPLSFEAWGSKLRLWSGLFMFAFCLSHFTNHALGIVSVAVMDRGSHWHYAIWGSNYAVALLALAAFVHVGLALWKTARRHTLKMPAWEFVQLVLGLYIPWTLTPHVLATLGLKNAFGIIPTYPQMLTLLWPDGALMQSVLLIVVWTHAMVGLHFWLRIYPLYRRFLPFLSTLAIAYPLVALWGWIEGARRQALVSDYELRVNGDHLDWVYGLTDQIRAIIFGLIILSVTVVLFRLIAQGLKRKITVGYPGGRKVRALPGASVLEISRMNDIPHMAVCGGRARCSTCRVRILSTEADLPAVEAAEHAVLERIGADDTIRLGCQLRPTGNIEIEPLVPVSSSGLTARPPSDAYHWGIEKPVVIMFVDLRNFTALTEISLSYDIVHLLNRYLDTVSAAIRMEGGHVDKFVGDGIMAIFGMETGLPEAARAALKACGRIGQAIDELNQGRGPQFADPLRIGVGLHAGPAILGRIGAAGDATASKTPITALGDVVNTASRLEAENKRLGTELAVSESVLKSAGVELPEACHDEITLRGKAAPLQIFAVEAIRDLRIRPKAEAADVMPPLVFSSEHSTIVHK